MTVNTSSSVGFVVDLLSVEDYVNNPLLQFIPVHHIFSNTVADKAAKPEEERQTGVMSMADRYDGVVLLRGMA